MFLANLNVSLRLIIFIGDFLPDKMANVINFLARENYLYYKFQRILLILMRLGINFLYHQYYNKQQFNIIQYIINI